jgi:hypothetical protein
MPCFCARPDAERERQSANPVADSIPARSDPRAGVAISLKNNPTMPHVRGRSA